MLNEKELTSIRHIYIEAAKKAYRKDHGNWRDIYKFLDLAIDTQNSLEKQVKE